MLERDSDFCPKEDCLGSSMKAYVDDDTILHTCTECGYAWVKP